MMSVRNTVYILPTNPAVKWLATQERNISKELPYTDSATERPEEYVLRTYLQFLWLPQSIMPLQLLLPALLRVADASPSTSEPSVIHPLHSLLQPILLTSRASSQKYSSRIPQLIAEESDCAQTEDEYVWDAYNKDKANEVHVPEGQDENEAHEQLKHAWFERMERREVQIQILLHFLLLTLPGHGAPPSAEALRDLTLSLPLPPPLSPSKSKKRKDRERGKSKAPQASPQPLEERLESYMDKLAMWQLMWSVDSKFRPAHAQPAKPATAGLDGGQDDRDWMQAFCEDLVEPLFKEKLPDFCALFRSKLFREAAISDTDTVDLSPPTSPKRGSKRLKTSASAASGPSAAAGSSKAKDDAATRARSRSLSMSLEQEQRERSRSVSIAPGGLRKRGIVREVSMTTVFKGKERAKSRASIVRTGSALAPSSSLSRSRSQSESQRESSQQNASSKVSGKTGRGKVLVAATPTKARVAQSQSQPAETQTRLPALFGGASSSQASSHTRLIRADSLDIAIDADADDDDNDDDDVNFATPTKARVRGRSRKIVHDTEDEDAGDEWTLRRSPDVLLLGAPPFQEWDSETPGATTPPTSSSPGDLGGFARSDGGGAGDAGRSRGRILVGDTPTKAR
ncbi:DNA replication regulator SLD3-domain-containing protein [Trametes gibbosa]|nr:DNA replication regulator SLD3-domain-containing protein [Trametes gibbosa]